MVLVGDAIEAVDVPAFLAPAIEKEKLSANEVGLMLAEFRSQISLADLQKRTRAIVVTDESQTDLIKQAHDLRLELKAVRVHFEKTRKELKEPSLRRTQVIDGTSRIVQGLLAEEEAYLLEQEQFAERQEAKRIAARGAEREGVLRELDYDPSGMTTLATMPESEFEMVVAGVKAQKAEAEAAERERQRIAKEKEEETERLRAENERLQKEKDDADRKLREAEAEAKRQKDEADRKEAERQAAEAAEAKRLADEAKRIADEAALAAAAPDREKLYKYAADVRQYAAAQVPQCENPTATSHADAFWLAVLRASEDLEIAAKTLRTETAVAATTETGDCPF